MATDCECSTLSDLQVPFEDIFDAELALKSLTVDPEPPRSGVTKAFRIEGNSLCVYVGLRTRRMIIAPVCHFSFCFVLHVQVVYG